ncbi:MAG: hypothetical protein II183_03490, partial [Elusimicrobiaceae bacterium]|nr:hypothetical protein [Elusimicrobiaceae bacterium]
KNSNLSKITEIFSWFELKMQKCSKCQKVFYYFNNHETFELDIASCFIANNGATLTIEKCLQFQSHKSQESFCEICQTYYPMDINIKIYSSPTYFVFSLNRQGNPAENLINIPFFLEYNINISQFLEEKKCFSKYYKNFMLCLPLFISQKTFYYTAL